MSGTSRVGEVWRYPLKSARGERLERAEVEPWGLAGDRRWMLVDDDGGAVTAREVNRLLLVGAEITETGLRLSAPGVEALDVRRPDPSVQRPVRLWSSELTAAATPQSAGADEWCSQVAGRSLHLVWLDDPRRRPVDDEFGRAEDRVSLADGYPLLLTTRASLAALDDDLLATRLETTGEAGEPLPMRRFRPNVVVDGTAGPWVEDDWRRVRIGDTTYRAVKGCARCVMTTVDPDTAERGHEPTATLARTRRWDGGVWFGINLVPDLEPDGARGWLAEGDDVEVLAAVRPGDGPLRSATVGRGNPVARSH